MKYLSPERLHVTQTAGITQLSPVNGRLYTLTHSDTTGTLFLTVSRAFVTDQLTSQRDEVLGEWKQAGQQLVFFGFYRSL
ncbi:staygreen family protein [Geobacillus sp. Sah69]|uniref:staygreen family protein n=1 Tax=Geobacillus sp. Sah69 TaxID=1737624 RepID=UPI000AB1CBBC|nr:staygreen family protein [Geobacillus sp. Sah69]